MQDVAVAIDMGGTNTVMGVVNREGVILSQKVVPTTGYAEFSDYISMLASEIKPYSSEFNILGIGMGAPDVNYYNGCIEHATNLPWKGILPLRESLEAATGYSALVTNDANAAALGEKLFGGAKDLSDFMVITLGTGLGSGIVVNGEVLYGASGLAGEVGHTLLVPNGRECGCGRRGCVEAYVSATGLCRTVSVMLGESSKESTLRALSYDKITSKAIYEAAKSGDAIAIEAFKKTIEWLAQTLANCVAFTSPAKIFLFGGLAKAVDLLVEPLKEVFPSYCLEALAGTCSIELSALPEADAALLGAAALIWDKQ